MFGLKRFNIVVVAVVLTGCTSFANHRQPADLPDGARGGNAFIDVGDETHRLSSFVIDGDTLRGLTSSWAGRGEPVAFHRDSVQLLRVRRNEVQSTRWLVILVGVPLVLFAAWAQALAGMR